MMRSAIQLFLSSEDLATRVTLAATLGAISKACFNSAKTGKTNYKSYFKRTMKIKNVTLGLLSNLLSLVIHHGSTLHNLVRIDDMQ